MATLSAVAATHDGSGHRPIGLRGAVIARRALLGDCTTLLDNAKAVLSRRYWRRPGCVVPIGERRSVRPASAAELAVGVSRRLLELLPDVERQQVGAVIYCHEAPDERVSESTVGRLQFELGLRAANPFAISQAHNVGLWIGLELALGLVDGPEEAEHVLLVASDKLVFAGPGTNARRLLFGDVAAAGLVSRSSQGWRVVELRVRQFATPCDALSPWPAECVAAFASFGAQLLRQALRDAGVGPAQLHAVLASAPEGVFARTVHREAGLAARPASPRHSHTSSSADLLLALAAIGRSAPIDGHVLAWSAGNNGEFAWCVLTRC